MNIHDKAHELANMLKASDEYRSFLSMKQALETDEQAKKMVKAFIAKQMEAEMAMMSGQPEDKAVVAQLQQQYELLSINSRARDFLHAYMKFQRMMADVHKILGEAVAGGMDIFAKQ